MLNVEEFQSMSAQDWEATISRLDGNPLQLPAVLSVTTDLSDMRYLLFYDHGTPVGASISARVTRYRMKYLPAGHTIYLPTPPAYDPGVCTPDDIAAALSDFARQKGYRSLTINAGYGCDYRASGVFGSCLGNPLLEFCVDLSRGIDAVYSGMHKSHRKNLRAAEKAGVIISEGKTLEDFFELRTLQISSSDRASTRGNPYSLPEEEYYAESYQKVYAGGPGRFFLARKDETVVAALAFLRFHNKAITVRSGASRLGYETSAMYLLQDALFKTMIELGVSEINIGGVPAAASDPSHPQHGLYNFKRYFGGQPCHRTPVEMEL